MPYLVDATGERHALGSQRERLVSVVPSTTETLFRIGAGERVVGVTRFCVRPEQARETARNVGGTKSPDLEAIVALEPDLVFANQEENRREDVLWLRDRVPVFVAFPRTVPEAIDDIRSAGKLLALDAGAAPVASELEKRLESLRSGARPFRYLYFIWQRPYMVAGSSTFVASLLSEGGGRNAAPSGRGRYPEMSLEEIRASGADTLLLSSEPFPFEARHADEMSAKLGAEASERARLRLVDGQLLSWHGTRLLEGLPYLERLAARIGDMGGETASPAV